MRYSSHHITDEDIEAVTVVLKSDHLAGRGDVVAEFEEKISDYTGYRYAIAVNSATSGLFVLSVLLKDYLQNNPIPERGINGSHIIVPALTFVATMNAPLLAGFDVNIRGVDYNFTLEDGYENRPRIVVSYGGEPVESDGLTIRDDAHRLIRDMGIGETCFGSVISTHGIKPITTGEGGVILTNHYDVYMMARDLCDHGVGQSLYGFNFRMPALNAALGISQLSRAGEYHTLRNEIAGIYDRDAMGGVVTNFQLGENSSRHIYPIVLKSDISTNKFRAMLKERGINTQVHYEPLYSIANRHSQRNRINTRNREDYKYSELMWQHGFSLPIHNGMTLDDAYVVVEKFNEVCKLI